MNYCQFLLFAKHKEIYIYIYIYNEVFEIIDFSLYKKHFPQLGSDTKRDVDRRMDVFSKNL